MKRREAIAGISVVAGGSLLLPGVLLTGCDPGPYKYELFNWGDTELLNEIADVILPDTPEVPGAKAANVGDFIQLYVTDCYKPKQKTAFLKGYDDFKLTTKSIYNGDFTSLSSEKKNEIIDSLEKESKEFKINLQPEEVDHFYTLLKGTILFGYFTSEIGATKALRYLPTPGEQHGDIPYNGERAWAL